MLLSSTFVALTLVSRIAAAPADLWERGTQVVLGYRTVDKAEADKINAVGAPVWENVEYYGGRQIGPGVYTSPKAGQWNPYPGAWYCIIYCDSDALDRVSKAWVPSDWNSVKLWNKENNINDYITNSLDSTWDPAKTLRMSIIARYEPDLQLLIPGDLVPESGGMKLQANCYPNLSDLPTSVTVNYDDWQNNIKGDKNPGSDPHSVLHWWDYRGERGVGNGCGGNFGYRIYVYHPLYI